MGHSSEEERTRTGDGAKKPEKILDMGQLGDAIQNQRRNEPGEMHVADSNVIGGANGVDARVRATYGGLDGINRAAGKGTRDPNLRRGAISELSPPQGLPPVVKTRPQKRVPLRTQSTPDLEATSAKSEASARPMPSTQPGARPRPAPGRTAVEAPANTSAAYSLFDDVAETSSSPRVDVKTPAEEKRPVGPVRSERRAELKVSEDLKQQVLEQEDAALTETTLEKVLSALSHRFDQKMTYIIRSKAPNITDDEITCLFNYTGGMYRAMNCYLRGQIRSVRWQEALKGACETTRQGLSKVGDQKKHTTYRGWKVYPKEGAEAVVRVYGDGSDKKKVITEQAFMSTSLDPELGEFDGPVRIEIDSYSGVDLKELSLGKEKEVLIPPGTSFKVKSVKRDRAAGEAWVRYFRDQALIEKHRAEGVRLPKGVDSEMTTGKPKAEFHIVLEEQKGR